MEVVYSQERVHVHEQSEQLSKAAAARSNAFTMINHRLLYMYMYCGTVFAKDYTFAVRYGT